MVLALDIGGTNIRSAVVKRDRVFEYAKTRTPRKQKEMLAKLFEVVESYGRQKKICVSTAGFERDGKIVNSLNNEMSGVKLREILRKKFGARVFVGNDANCATLAEFYYGVGKGKKNFILLTLGSGIGGGAVLNGKLYVGNGGALEVGSMRINGNEIWEKSASGNASIRIAREMGLRVDSVALEELAKKGDKKARKVYDVVGKNLGIGIANLSFIFDPEIIVLGGGFSRVKYIYPAMNETFGKLYSLRPLPKIVRARFGDDAGLIGAGLLPKVK